MSDHSSEGTNDSIEGASTETEADVLTTADGTLSGKVIDANGDPIQRADVKIFLSSNGSQRGGTTTDDNGFYSESLSPEDYDVLVEKAGYQPGEATNVTVSSNTTTREDFSLSLAFRKVIGDTDAQYGIGTLARNTATSGWNYGLKAVTDSNDGRSNAIRATARGSGDAIRGETRTPSSDGIVGRSTANTGFGTGVIGLTGSSNDFAAGVFGSAPSDTGTPSGVWGRADSDGSAGVYGSNGASSGYAVFAEGWLGVERNVKETGDTNLGRHAATVVNTSSQSGADVLGLQTANLGAPDNTTNFISFLDSNSQLGAIEGNSGGVNFTGTTADFAEFFPKADPDREFEGGQVVGLDHGEVVASVADADAALVVSAAPLVLGNAPGEEADRDEMAKLTLVGQTPVRVSAPVASGDVLVASPDDDGTAVPRRQVGRAGQPAVGIALASHDGGDGEVLMLVGGPGVAASTTAARSPSDSRADSDRVGRLERENDRLREQVRALEETNQDLRERLAAVEESLELDGTSKQPTPSDD